MTQTFIVKGFRRRYVNGKREKKEDVMLNYMKKNNKEQLLADIDMNGHKAHAKYDNIRDFMGDFNINRHSLLDTVKYRQKQNQLYTKKTKRRKGKKQRNKKNT